MEDKKGLAVQLDRLFSVWGYRWVEPPLVEDLDTFRQGGQGIGEERVYRFVDRDARLLALRPDMTAGIANLVARQSLPGSGDESLPLRLRYEGSVFRNESSGNGRSRTIRQAGIELIGEAGPEADAEVMAIAMAAVAATGARSPRLIIGHVGLAWGMLALAGPTDSGRREEFRTAVLARDLVAVERLLGEELAGIVAGGPYGLSQAQRLLEGLAARGQELGVPARQVLDLLAALPAYGLEHVLLDLALLRDLDYYSGVVFEVVVPGLAVPLAGGGRYDRLLARFGRDLPATGFALNLDAAIPAAGGYAEYQRRFSVAWAGAGDREAALAIASSLRSDGATVETLPAGLAVADATARARARGAGRLLYVAAGAYREVRIDSEVRRDSQLGRSSPAVAGIH